jgi:hypothetical protein
MKFTHIHRPTGRPCTIVSRHNNGVVVVNLGPEVSNPFPRTHLADLDPIDDVGGGKWLFNMYVSIGLCTTAVYEWEKLSPALQGRWGRLAEQVKIQHDAKGNMAMYHLLRDQELK